MPLTVLNVGFPLASVTPSTAGGAEQVLSLLDDALVKAGHRSIVVAPAGSCCRGKLLPLPAVESRLDEEKHAIACEQQRSTIAKALSDFPIDMIHMHGIDFYRYLPTTDVPVLVTLHLPPSWYPREIFNPDRQDFRLVCVSQSQARSCPAEARIEAVIENGVCVPEFRPVPKEDYVAALGRICPEKGFHIALDAASKARLPLVLAGRVFEYASHEQYWNKELKPRLKPPHRFVGLLGPQDKQILLRRACCLVISSLVEETSSLVAMEAMACGTAVVALRRGALPEIIEEGRTGFLVDSPEQLPDAMRAAKHLNPVVCREQAVARFSSSRMTGRYLQLYRHLTVAPRRTFHSNAEWVA